MSERNPGNVDQADKRSWVRTLGKVNWDRIMATACRTEEKKKKKKTRYTVDEIKRRIDEDHMLTEDVPRRGVNAERSK
jgi:thiamine pyrophosphate-dependent acetolactate synthase large subunit-like protein